MTAEEIRSLGALSWEAFSDRVLEHSAAYARIIATVIDHETVVMHTGWYQTPVVRVKCRGDDGAFFNGTVAEDRFIQADIPPGADALMSVEGERFRSSVSLFIGAMTALSSATVNDILNDPDFNPNLLRKRGTL